MGQIVNIQGSAIANLSNIGLNRLKVQAMPPDWYEVDGYREHFRTDDTSAVRYFRGPWGNRKVFFDWCLGYSSAFTAASNFAPIFVEEGNLNIPGLGDVTYGQIVNNPTAYRAFLTRYLPAQHPEYPWMYAVDCELVRGDGETRLNPHVVLTDGAGKPVLDDDDQPIPVPMIGYIDGTSGTDLHSALVAVTYRNLPYEIRTDEEIADLDRGEMERFVERTINYSLSAIPIQGGNLKFVDGPQAGAAIPENAAHILLPMEELTYTWYDVPDLPRDAFTACVGKVNSESFDGARGWPDHPPETLLCQPPQVTRQRNSVGRISWRIVYKFLKRPNGWNRFPDRTGTFRLATDGGTPQGERPYKSADFQELFVPPFPRDYQ